MKLLVSALLIITLLLSAHHSFGQRINLSYNNTPVTIVAASISKQIKYSFAFYTRVGDKKITIDVRRATLREVLDIFQEQGVFSEILENKNVVLYADSGMVRSNARAGLLWDLKGKIRNESGDMMDGVTVTVKNTGDATATNQRGEFHLRLINKNITLIITSAVTEPAEIEVNGPDNLLITVKTKIDTMNEVVVNTGYQEVKKARTSGSFVQLDNSIFSRKVTINALDRIEGMASGVLFDRRNGGNLNIQIRGLFTLTQSISQPLIVVDNFPYEGNINNLNPNDIESITILKDAAASSIWGARAGNGVIVIKMKSGTFGRAPRVSFNTNLTFRKKPDLFKIPNMSPADYIEAERTLFDSGAYNADINDPAKPLSPVVDILLKERNGLLTEDQANAQLNLLSQSDIRNDFQRYLYRTGWNQQYAVNIIGGTDKVKYFFSAGYDRGTDNLVGNSNDRVTLRSDNTFKPFENLQIRAALNYAQITNIYNSPLQYTNEPQENNRKLPLYSRLADAQGNPLSIMYDYREAYTDTLAGGRLLDWKYRPLQELANNNNVLKTHTLTANLDLRYNFTSALNGEVKYQYQRFVDKDSKRYNTETYFARNRINLFTQINGNNIEYILPIGDKAEYRNAYMDAHALRAQLNFNKTLHGKHMINALGGFELRQNNTSADIYYKYGENVNTGVSYPLITGGSTYLTPDAINTNKTDSRFVSLYSNASYSYMDRYLITGSIRRDASNIFGVRANQKWVPLWSIGAGWKISKENFFNIPAISYLNLRTTYGLSGNVNNTWSALTTINRFPSDGTNIFYTTIGNFPNPQLRWEKVKTFNIGVDFSIKNKRAEGSIEYFSKKSSDVLALRELDPTVGVLTLTTNSAGLTGSGLDFQVNTLNIDHTNFKWRSGFIYSHIRYKVSRYFSPDRTSVINNELDINPLEGYTPYLLVSTKWAGLDASGDPRGILNGQVSKNYTAILDLDSLSDYYISGSALPVDFGSFLNTFSWKRFAVSANIIYKLNYFFRRPTIRYDTLAFQLVGHPDYSKRWQKPGDENKTIVPALRYPGVTDRDRFYANSEVMVEKGDYIRLDDIKLSYDFNKNNKIPFRQMQAYLYLSNLNIILWKANKAGIDPEFPNGVKPALSVAAGFKVDF